MSKNVFISGSISIGKLPKNAIAKLDSIIEKQISVLVGDAKGVDLQVQKYLLKRSYNNVLVYYAGQNIRYNVGNWKTRHINADTHTKGRELYTKKDKAMAYDTDYGLMIWDGQSKGTRNNITYMKELRKKFFVIIENMLISDNQVDSFLNISNSIAEQPSLF
ncbi:MAG: hypothetical protein LBL46_00325 [Rickettsiales bacterium]|jgi:hypothetical protein|nr:hypothetical protein [Rickettsiales bacterium]